MSKLNKDTNKWLGLNLQHFSSKEDEGGDDDLGGKDDKGTPEGAIDPIDKKEPLDDKTIPYDRFKAKVDEVNAMKEKLAGIETAEAEKERLALVEQEKYKELYEQAQQDIATAQADALAVRKDALLSEAGYSKEQATLLGKLVEGTTSEELSASIEVLKASIPVKAQGVDPSPMNGKKDDVKPSDKTEIGASAYERIKGRLF